MATVPTLTPSIRTSSDWGAVLFADWAAKKLIWYVPAAKVTVWLMLLLPWMKAT